MALSLRERGEAAALEDCSGEELIRIAGVFEVFEREGGASCCCDPEDEEEGVES
jgi:hypothetical protein